MVDPNVCRHLGRKVLIVGNIFGRDLSEDFYMIMPKLLHGFVRIGCNVQVFNDRETARGATPLLRSAAGRSVANRRLLKACRNFRPDLLLLGHCKLIDNATLDQARAALPGLRIAYRNVDPLPDAANRARIQRRAPAVDAIFLTAASPIQGIPPDSPARVYFCPTRSTRQSTSDAPSPAATSPTTSSLPSAGRTTACASCSPPSSGCRRCVPIYAACQAGRRSGAAPIWTPWPMPAWRPVSAAPTRSISMLPTALLCL